MKRLTTRGPAVAKAIYEREDFRTHGALYGESRILGTFDSGRLTGEDLERFYRDCADIRYVVMSYATPIAWWVPPTESHVGGWYKVKAKFSITTTKHQGNLYLI